MAEASKRYVAFLRGVSPLNAKMPELKRAFELASFRDVKTVLSSGNVVFTAARATNDALARQAEAAMQRHLGRTFFTIIRSVEQLQKLLGTNPYGRLKSGTKRVVTFLSAPANPKLTLPLELKDARIIAIHERELFTTYVPGPKSPTFMPLIERTFGKNITTRTWETLIKIAKREGDR